MCTTSSYLLEIKTSVVQTNKAPRLVTEQLFPLKFCFLVKYLHLPPPEPKAKMGDVDFKPSRSFTRPDYLK